MIFVTVGSQKFQFNRLLQAIDKQIATKKIPEEVFAQIGFSTYQPRHFAFSDFLNRVDFEKKIQKSEIVVTHGGTGAIVGALKLGKKVIAIPRLAVYGEHVDDHQLQIIEQFETRGMIRVCRDPENLSKDIESVRSTKYVPYKSNEKEFIEEIKKYIDNL